MAKSVSEAIKPPGTPEEYHPLDTIDAARRVMSPAVAEHLEKIFTVLEKQGPDETIETLADQERKSNIIKAMTDEEFAYGDRLIREIKEFSKAEALVARYEGSHRKSFLASVAENAERFGVDVTHIPEELKNISFEEDAEITERMVLQIVEQFFQPDQKLSPRKREIVEKQTKEYISLIKQAQTDDAIANNLKAEEVYRIIMENLASLSLQDVASDAVELGTHGLYHLVEHNINFAIQVCDELEKKLGIKIPAIIRLMIHQIMLDHDKGYAVPMVVTSMAEKGPKGQDAGHPLLASQLLREGFDEESNPLNKLFTPELFRLIHHAILYHDKNAKNKAAIDFQIGDQDKQPATSDQGTELTQVALQRILPAIIRFADNMHAFADKAAGVFVPPPENKGSETIEQERQNNAVASSLLALKELSIIDQCHDLYETDEQKEQNKQLIERIKQNLIASLMVRTDIHPTYKESLIRAAQKLTPQSWSFLLPRLITGTKPQFEYGRPNIAGENDRKIYITLQPSEKSKQLMRLYYLENVMQQPEKFIEDLTGKKVTLGQDDERIEVANFVFILEKSQGLSDLDRDLQQGILEHPDFMKILDRDGGLASRQALIIDFLKMYVKKIKAGEREQAELELRKEAAARFEEDELRGLSIDQIKQKLDEKIRSYKQRRLQLLHGHLTEKIQEEQLTGVA